MKTRERRLMEAEIVLKISQLSEENKRELINFMEWIKANKPTPDEITAEMERRQRNIA